jgi:hypothetical protein
MQRRHRLVRRWLGHVVVGTSLILSVAVVGLWLHTSSRLEDVGLATVSRSPGFRRDRQFQLSTASGGPQWTVTTYEHYTPEPIATAEATQPPKTEFWRNVSDASGAAHDWTYEGKEGFWYRHDEDVGDRGMSFWDNTVRTPFWFLLLLASAPFVASVVWRLARAVARQARARAGHCIRCGYDLRGTTVRCPECGTPAAHRAAA